MKMQRSPNRQKGEGMISFIMYLILAALLLLGVIKLYNMAVAWSKQASTASAVTQIKAGAEKVKSVNHSGTSMSKVCATGRNAASSTICGDTRDGKGTNEYGGDYTLTANTSNLQQVNITVTNVDSQYIDDLADTLAKISAGNCNSAASCSAISVSGTTITVTM